MACLQATDDKVKVITRLPAKLIAGSIIEIHAVDALEHFPAPADVLRLIVHGPPADHGRRIGAQLSYVRVKKRRRRTDDVATEADRRRAFCRQQVRADNVFDVHAPEQKFVDLDVVVYIALPRKFVVVLLREKSGGPEHKTRQPMVPVEQLAKILRRSLGDTIDVLRDSCDLLANPGSRRCLRRHQRVAKDARAARKDQSGNTRGGCLLQKIERAGDVDVDKIPSAMRPDVRFVQGSRVENDLHPLQAAFHERPVDNRADVGRVWRGPDVGAGHVMLHGCQSAHERLAEVPATTGDQDSHDRVFLAFLAGRRGRSRPLQCAARLNAWFGLTRSRLGLGSAIANGPDRLCREGPQALSHLSPSRVMTMHRPRASSSPGRGVMPSRSARRKGTSYRAWGPASLAMQLGGTHT